MLAAAGPGRADEGARPEGDGEGEHWVDRWRFSQRMALVVGLPALLLVTGTVFVAVQVNEIEAMEEREAEGRAELAEVIDLERSFARIVEASQTYVMTGDAQNRSRLESEIAAFETRLTQQDEPLEGPQGEPGYGAMEENATAYIGVVRRAQDLVEGDDPQQAQQLLAGPEAQRARTNTDEALGTLQQVQRQDVEAQREAIRETHDSLDRGVLLGAIGALLATGLVGYDVTQRTRRTMARNDDAMRGRLAELERARQAATDQLEAQQEAMRQALARVEDVLAGAANVTEHVDQADQMASTVHDMATEGHRRVETTMRKIEETDTSVSEVADEILAMSDAIDQLEEAADDVVGLCDQIDMLALNASVAASHGGDRSGELDEVRGIAERAQHRGEEIKEVLLEARERCDAAAIAIERSGKAIGETRATADGAAEWLQELGERLEGNRAQLEDLAASADKQTDNLDEAFARLDTTRERTHDVKQTNERARDLVEELEEVEGRLRALR